MFLKGTSTQSKILKFVFFVKLFDFQKRMFFKDPHWNKIICTDLF